ncbi:hypothetical protein BH20ACT15_BH20ACT15_00510 [soil metagenome]
MNPPRGVLDAPAIFKVLVEGGVEFVVIGGFAVIAHGYVRATEDVDICPDPRPDNLARLATVLAQLEAKVEGVEEFGADELPRPDREGLVLGGNFVLSTRHGGLDILQLVGPDLEYADLAADAVELHAHGSPIRVCSYPNLIRMKEAAGRPGDEADLARLREARGEDG